MFVLHFLCRRALILLCVGNVLWYQRPFVAAKFIIIRQMLDKFYLKLNLRKPTLKLKKARFPHKKIKLALSKLCTKL